MAIAAGKIEELVQRNIALAEELVVVEAAASTAIRRKSTETRKLGVGAKKSKKLQQQVERLERKDHARKDQIEDLRDTLAAVQQTSSPKKRKHASTTKLVRQNIQRWATDAAKRLTKLHQDPAKVNAVVAAMFELQGQPDSLLDLKSKLSTAYARSKETLCDLLPEGFLTKENEAAYAYAAKEVVDRIQERWSVVMGNKIKTLHQMSRRKYIRLRETLSTVLDPTTGLHVPFELPHGTVMPTLPTYYQILKKKMDLREKFGVVLDNDTKAVQLDVYRLEVTS